MAGIIFSSTHVESQWKRMRSVEKPYPSVKGKKRGFYNRVVLSIFRVKNPTRNPEIFGLQTRTQLNGNSTDLTRFHCDSTSVDEKTISDIFRHEGAVQDRRNVRSHELVRDPDYHGLYDMQVFTCNSKLLSIAS
jgi:hypothetical protein